MSDYFRHHFGFIFVIIPYNLPFGIGSMVVNFLFTFMWNYMDLFIVMVSLGLSSRFQQINHRIEALAGREVSEATWMEIRHHFVLLCELLEAVDETMSGIILLSSINNLYFICYQLLNILQKLRYTINYVYFWYSLLYLASRTTGVFLHAASINDEAAKPLKILRAVPSRNWCSEIERFTDQITTQRVALSGMKFFYLTRKLFFGMAGTIVTYELVLLQFDDPNPNLKPLCG
ncbi:gustatory receptor for sugar taste 64a-like [Hermetia illucens]|nr:gustatory receptor for sugar taste 64a-like [Hermetia illucens]